MNVLTPQEVTHYYRWLLGREPEPEVLAHFQSTGIRRPQLVSMIMASEEFTQRMQRLGLPNAAPSAQPELEPDVRAPAFWKRYVPFMNPDSPAPFREVAFQTFYVPTNSGGFTIRSMLSSLELALLFALAKDHWSGAGEIVDLGCLYGLTTRCLADGLAHNARVPEAEKRLRIYAYDLFLPDDYGWGTLGSPTVHAGSLFPEFLIINRDRLDMIAPCPGDLLHMSWGGKPIEILMIDAAKAWELNTWIVRNLFPNLIPGKSIVVQQDQIHFDEYWIMIAMEWFADHFEFIDAIYGSSGYYLCTAAISAEQAAVDLAGLPFREKERLLLAAIARCRPSAQAALQGAYAKLLIDCDRPEQARAVLDAMDVTRQEEDPVYDFSGIAQSDRGYLLSYLDRLGAAAPT